MNRTWSLLLVLVSFATLNTQGKDYDTKDDTNARVDTSSEDYEIRYGT